MVLDLKSMRRQLIWFMCKLRIAKWEWGKSLIKDVCGENGVILWFLHGYSVDFSYCQAGGLLLVSLTAWARDRGCY